MPDLLFAAFSWLAGCMIHPKMELASVGDDYAVFFRRQKGSVESVRIDDLKPGQNYVFYGKHFRTLERPAGKLLSRFVTVNDVHIGESICGFDSHHPKRGPVLKNEPGKQPYAEMMSRIAVGEIRQLNPDAVLVKGDLTDAGKPEDIETFLQIWGEFGSKFHWVCGNHDVHTKRPAIAPLTVRVDLPGVTLAMLDTSIEEKPTGQISSAQLAWLEEIAAKADRPVMVFGHHHIWNPGSKRDPSFFGINPNDSEKLIEMFRRNKCFVGYFSGHTHSNHVDLLKDLPDVPLVQTGALKEFPGAWYEYRVYESGIQQIMHRVSAEEGLRWQELTSKMELGFYEKRHYGKLSERCFNIGKRL